MIKSPEPSKVEEALIVNGEWQKVLAELKNGTQPVFITGGAGVGKSTLLQKHVAESSRTSAIVAPTGVAALRVRGTTIHKFFGFEAKTQQSDEIYDVSAKRREKYQALDDLIIDEASMVRADLMDAIDKFLRVNGREKDKPFGGVRLILVGDLFQLPPVSKEKEEKAYLKDRYGTDMPYFFHAEAWRDGPPKIHELTTIFRQSDLVFTEALNAIRRGTATDEHLALLNGRVNRSFQPPAVGDLWLILTTTNANAEQANHKMLSEIKSLPEVFIAVVQGKFNLKDAPTDEELRLKVGASVMFIRNDSDRRWQNGTMGKVVSLKPLMVDIAGRVVDVTPETWESISYDYDAKAKKLHASIEGKFTQIPLKLAAAITIHKCLTGDSVVATANRGLVPIKDIVPDDTVYTQDGSAQKVTLSSYIGQREIVSIRTVGGREIHCTAEHKLCVLRNGEKEWIEAQWLNPKDLLITPSFVANEEFRIKLPNVEYTKRDKKRICPPSEMTTDLAWWLGVLIGDGSYSDTKEGQFWLTVSSPEVRDRFASLTQSFGIYVGSRKKQKSQSFDLYFNSLPLRRWLVNIDLDYDRAASKSVPSIVSESNATIRASFVQGLFDTDGSVNKDGRIIFTTVSRELAEGLHLILDSIGIEARKHKPQPTSYVKNGTKTLTGNRTYQVRISGYDEQKFIDTVGFTRMDRLERWKSMEWSLKKCAHSKLKPNTDAIKTIAENVDFADVYDLEVENNHNFYANGLLVSNSQGTTLDRAILDLGFGAFADGQTYVGLSRLRSLDGLVLRKPIKMSDLGVNGEVQRFMKGEAIARPLIAIDQLL